jgi:DNA-binding transcriptional ArsR family regulator
MGLPFWKSAAYSKHFAGGRSVPIDVRFPGDDNRAMQHRRIATTAAMLADPGRAAMVLALMDGRSRSAKKLALDAGVTPQTATAHLKKLVAANILLWQGSGREKHFRISGHEVAQAVEALSELGGSPLTPAAREIRFARCCYDHLAGQLGVCVTARLLQQGNAVLANLGIDLQGLENSRRPLFRCCTDWTERRPHIAGALGAALLHHYKERRWLVPVHESRKLEVTPLGKAMFVKMIGVEATLFEA